MVKMKTILFILLFIRASKAEDRYNITCSNSPNITLTFKPSEDPHIEGRYKVEFCTKAYKNMTAKNVTEWQLTLRYSENIHVSKECENPKPLPDLVHSFAFISVKNNLNCTKFCFSTLLDLVFTNTCYALQSTLKYRNLSSRPHDSFHFITNNVTKENFTGNRPKTLRESYAEGQSILNWKLGYVPALYYYVTIVDNVTQKNFEVQGCNETGKFLSEVACLAVLPPGRCYKASLENTAYWKSSKLFSDLTTSYFMFCEPMPLTPIASSSPMGEWPTAVGIAALVLLAVALCCVLRRRHVADWQRRVRENWLKITSNESTKSSNVGGNILLLYARDCMQFRCAAERLGALVQRATGCQVIDVYSGASVRLWASGGDEWLRLMLERDNTRVLLLQSPAGALLAAELAETRAGPALSAPLLGWQACWRRPHAGDALLALALRQLAAAPPSTPYKKHYVANISGLGTDMAPSVTPFRRYTLPATVVSLLRDLAPSLKLEASLDLEPGLKEAPDLVLQPVPKLEGSDLEPLLQQFKEAADAFTDHVRDHPDYLADELLFK